jgi:hypothetical protein
MYRIWTYSVTEFVKSTTPKRSDLGLSNFCTSKIIMLSTTLIYDFSTETWFGSSNKQHNLNSACSPKQQSINFSSYTIQESPRSRDLNYSNALLFVRVKIINLEPTIRLANFIQVISALKLIQPINNALSTIITQQFAF